MALLCLPLMAQNELEFEVEVTYGRKLGKVQALRDRLPTGPTAPELRNFQKANRPPRTVPNFRGDSTWFVDNKNALPSGMDPLLQILDGRSGILPSAPIVSQEGLSFLDTEVSPPDVNGDVGDKYYLESVNATVLQVYNSVGDPVGAPFNANMIWEQVDQRSLGDPIILYDQAIDRWLLTEFQLEDNGILMALSDDEDPLGGWTAYQFNTPSFPDYPKYGIWPETYLLTVNEPANSNAIFYTIDRQAMIAGDSEFKVLRLSVPKLDQPGLQALAPVGWTGDIRPPEETVPVVARINDDAWGQTGRDLLELYEVHINWNDKDSTELRKIELETTPFDAEFCEGAINNIFTCIPQPDGPLISGFSRILLNKVVYRNFGPHASIVLNFGVDVTGNMDAGIRWMELRKAAGEDWSIYQEGTIGTTDGENRFLGSISIDEYGNIGLGYAVSSEVTYPSLRYTGRLTTDPLGTMTVEEVEFATGKRSSAISRYGDYHSMSVDRQNIFWYAGEYMPAGNAWSTRIAAFRLQRDDIDMGIRALQGPVDGPDLDMETISIEVTNFGNLPQTEFHVGYIFAGQDPVIDTVEIAELSMDSSYTHDFEKTVTFEGPGVYEVTTFISVQDDGNALNDTCAHTITKIGRIDASIYSLDGLYGVACDSVQAAQAVLFNAGADELTSCTIVYGTDQGQSDTLIWQGSLMPGKAEYVSLQYRHVNQGQASLFAYSTMPNGLQDERVENDTTYAETDVINEGGYVRLEFTTDLFPAESTWELLDTGGNVVFAGGPYDEELTTYVEEWCLDYSDCFRFIVYDSNGTGMDSSFFNEPGDFVIVDSNGYRILGLRNPEFGFTDINDLCLDFECTLSVIPFVTNETVPGSSNGIINFFTSGGRPPYSYSLDSGLTFQSLPLFTGLDPGEYQCIIRDDTNCEEMVTLTVLDCGLQTMIEATEASGADTPDGSIFIDAEGGRGALRYSINGGSSYQSEPLFEGLLPGSYPIQVRDSINCRVVDTVEIDFSTSVRTITDGNLMRVYPNPSQGVFNVEVKGISDVRFLEFHILDATGRIVRVGEAGVFNDTFKTAFMLNTDPPGVYYLRFLHEELTGLVRLVKQ